MFYPKFHHLLFLVALLTLSCAPRLEERAEDAHVMALMDQHNYAAAAPILEQQVKKNPNNDRATVLLAESYLGESGLELSSLLSNLQFSQDLSLQKLIPSQISISALQDKSILDFAACKTLGTQKIKELNLKCLPFIIYDKFPNPDSPFVRKARNLLEQHFNKARSAPSNVNFLIAFVDSSSALARLKLIVNGHGDFHQFKHFILDGVDSLKRLRFSYAKIQKFILEHAEAKFPILDKDLFTAEGEFDVDQAGNLFGAWVKQILANQKYEIQKTSEEQAKEMIQSLPSFMQQVDSSLFDNRVSPILSRVLNMETGGNQLIKLIADHRSIPIPVLSILTFFVDHPPLFIQDLVQSFKASWQSESMDSFSNSLARAEAQLEQLENLEGAWVNWYQNTLTPDQQTALLDQLSATFSGTPPTQEQLDQTYESLLFTLMSYSQTYTQNTSDQARDLANLTTSWFSANFYPISPRN